MTMISPRAFEFMTTPITTRIAAMCEGYPATDVKHNPEKETTTIEIAVPGFTRTELAASVNGNFIHIVGTAIDAKDPSSDRLICSNITKRSFARKFELKEGAEVEQLTLRDGILKISLIYKPKSAETKRLSIE